MRQNIQIRASSLSELFDCPARWEAKHLNGLRLPAGAGSRLGTAVHAGAALFDQARLEGNRLTCDETAGAVVDVIYDKGEEVAWDDFSQKEAENIALPLHRLYCDKIAPKQTYAAVEALCDDLLLTDLGIILTGTVDRIRETEDGFGICDIKTGKTAVGSDGTVRTQGHAAQVAVYELLAGHALNCAIDQPAQIIGLQVAKTEAGRRAGIGEIENSRQILVDSPDGRPGYLRHAANILHNGLFYGNPRSQLCNKKYCPVYANCSFRK